LLILAGCAHESPRAPASTEPVVACFAAHYIEPCGASAWHIGGAERDAFVRGPGSPTRLARNVLVADNAVEVCGTFAGTVADAEGGPMAVFEASAFKIAEPVQRLVCGDGFGVLDGCTTPDGKPARQLGPARLTDDDVEEHGHVACDGRGCRIASADARR